MNENEILAILKSLMAKRDEKQTDKTYVNPSAAILMKIAGREVLDRTGQVWKADAYASYFAEYVRTRNFQGTEAEEQVNLIVNKGNFIKQYKKLNGDSVIIPFDYWTDIPEQLTDTVRLGVAAPQGDATVVAQRMVWAQMFGDDIYVRHIERQFDLPIEIIRQYLYKPNFEQDIEAAVSIGIGNDITRLAVNGVSEAYTSGDPDFYKLLKSFFVILKESTGVKTLRAGNTRFVGRWGQLVTPVKIDAPALRFATPYSETCAANTYLSKYAVSAGTLLFDTDHFSMDAGGAWTGATLQFTDIIPVYMNTTYKASIDVKGSASNASDKGVLSVLDAAGNIIAQSPSTDVSHSAYTTISFTFNTYSNLGVRFKFAYSLTSADVDCYIQNMKIERASTKFEFNDIVSIMDTMIDSYPEHYDSEVSQIFQMSRSDVSLFAKSQRIPVYVTDTGQIVPMATETREDRMEQGQKYLEHRGYPIETLPYGKSLNLGGYIIFGPTVAEYRIGVQNIYSYTRRYEERLSTGGEGYKYTYHMYMNFGVRIPGKFVIAEGTGSSLTCETIVVGNSYVRTGSRIGTGTAVTYSKAANAAGFLFCDTPGSVIYYSTTTGDLDSYALAVANATLYTPGTDLEGLTNNTYYVRAFLDGVAQPSAKLTLTVGA